MYMYRALAKELVYLDSAFLSGCSVVRSPHDPGVVAALLELHHDVDEASDAALHSLAEGVVVLGQDPAVVLLLNPRHLHSQNLLHLETWGMGYGTWGMGYGTWENRGMKE